MSAALLRYNHSELYYVRGAAVVEAPYFHLSVDDVSQSLLDLGTKKHESIFDNPFFRQLKELHSDYHVKISLFIFLEDKRRNWNLRNFPEGYRTEFSNSADWLKFGIHGRSETYDKNRRILLSDQELKQSIDMMRRCFGPKSISNAVRLHQCYSSGDFYDRLYRCGVRVVLSCGDKRRMYYTPSINLWFDDTFYQGLSRYLRGNRIYKAKNGLVFVGSLSRIEEMNMDNFKKIIDEHNVVELFVHENNLIREFDKIRSILGILKAKNYMSKFSGQMIPQVD